MFIASTNENFTSVQEWEANTKMNPGQPIEIIGRLSAAAQTIPSLPNARQFPMQGYLLLYLDLF